VEEVVEYIVQVEEQWQVVQEEAVVMEVLHLLFLVLQEIHLQ
tara:strand:+ start:80 stop:205 length:126 start_codon:yes stop_codon:yes gene_type:complete